jgi:hypothetical protein
VVTVPGKRVVSQSAKVLRPVSSTQPKVASMSDLLTAKQRQELRRDLNEMARRRRDAEASTGSLRLG